MSIHEQIPDDDSLEFEPKLSYEQYLENTLDAVTRYQAGIIDMDEVYEFIVDVSRQSGKVAGNMSKGLLDQLYHEYENGPNHEVKLARFKEKVDELNQQIHELKEERDLIKERALVDLNSVASDGYSTAQELRSGYITSFKDLKGTLDDMKAHINLLDEKIAEIWAFHPSVGVASDSAKMSHDSERLQSELQYRMEKKRVFSGYREIVALANEVETSARKKDDYRLTSAERSVVRTLANAVYSWSSVVSKYKKDDLDAKIELCNHLLEPLIGNITLLERNNTDKKVETVKANFDVTIQKIKEHLKEALDKLKNRP